MGQSYCFVATCCLFDLTGRICLLGRQRKSVGQKKRGCLFSGNLRRNSSEHNFLLMMREQCSGGEREAKEKQSREECNFPLARPPSSNCHSSIHATVPPTALKHLGASGYNSPGPPQP